MSSPQHKQALPTGYPLHEYRIDAVLGHGAFGITWLALDNRIGYGISRPAVVK